MKSDFNNNKIQNQKSNQEINTHPNQDKSKTIPVIEEKLNIDIQSVEKSKTHISKQVHEENVTVDIPLIHENIEIQRVAKNISIDTPPEVRYEGNTMIIPIIKEEVIIQKKLVLVEEVHVTKHKTEVHEPKQVKLRKEEIRLDKTDLT